VKPRRPTRPSTVSRRSRHSTIAGKPPARPAPAHPPHRPPAPRLTLKSPAGRAPSSRRIARFIDDDESTLLDVLDNLLSKGVVLNAEVILALANVDLIYLRLSVVLCGAARVLPRSRR
jgi:hypothetical protein